MKKIGSINPCNTLFLYDIDNKCIGTCLDTPNAFAYACSLRNNIVKGIAIYAHFEDNFRMCNDVDIIERINYYKKHKLDNPYETFHLQFY